MVDPMLVVASVERQVSFVAKAPLFKVPLLGAVLRGMGCIPAYRSQDPGYEREKNQQLYDAVGAVLARGAAVGIFPEGRSHTDPRIAELKHGAARMALDAESAAGFELGLAVQLVGIHFEETRLHRGKALVMLAPPVGIGAYRAAYAQDPRNAVAELTRDLREGLATMVLEAENAELLRLAAVVERFGILEERDGGIKGTFERKKALLEGYRELLAERPGAMREVVRRVRRYDRLLAALAIRDDQLTHDYRWSSAVRYALANSALLALGLPFALAGCLLNALPYGLVRLAVHLSGARIDVRASSGLLAAIVVFPLWYAALAWAGWRTLPTSVWVPILAAAPALGIATVHWIERWHRVGRAAWGLWTALRLPGLRARLRAMRREILDALDALLPATTARG
jgi:1-acyl-sn-glycerol-3-phosphate acyltransferase